MWNNSFCQISRNEILETQQTSCKIVMNFVSKPSYNLINAELPGSEESNIYADLNKTLISGNRNRCYLVPTIHIKADIKQFERMI